MVNWLQEFYAWKHNLVRRRQLRQVAKQWTHIDVSIMDIDWNKVSQWCKENDTAVGLMFFRLRYGWSRVKADSQLRGGIMKLVSSGLFDRHEVTTDGLLPKDIPDVTEAPSGMLIDVSTSTVFFKHSKDAVIFKLKFI
jgi:hypothetical protein